MAKCIKKENGDIVRVSDKRAEELVYDGLGKYVSKTEWKEFLAKEKETV